MDKNKLSQLKYLKREIEMLKGQIDNTEYIVTTDKVKGSGTGFPYVLHDIKISGIDIKNYEKRLKRLRQQWSRKLEELTDLVEEINEYIDNVDDSLTRQILTLRYVNGLSWEQVAASVGGGNKAESLRKKVERFLEKE